MHSANILLVEDNPGDVRLLRKALEKARLESDLRVVEDGEEALHSYWFLNVRLPP